ncbi:hypothetical protein AB0G05_22410 [Nonomuraea wenchangensis]
MTVDLGGTITQTFTTGLPAGTYPNVAGSGTVTVDSGGRATVTVPGKSAVAIHTGSTLQPNDKEATVSYRTGGAATAVLPARTEPSAGAGRHRGPPEIKSIVARYT